MAGRTLIASGSLSARRTGSAGITRCTGSAGITRRAGSAGIAGITLVAGRAGVARIAGIALGTPSAGIAGIASVACGPAGPVHAAKPSAVKRSAVADKCLMEFFLLWETRIQYPRF